MSEHLHVLTPDQYSLLLQIEASPAGMAISPLRQHLNDVAMLVGARLVRAATGRVHVSSRGSFFASHCTLMLNGTAIMHEIEFERGGLARSSCDGLTSGGPDVTEIP